jgi:hypothetical protein
MTRKEILNQYLNHELNPIAIIGISNNSGIAILNILVDGMEEKVLGIYNNNEVFKRKVYYDQEDYAFFRLGSLRFYLNEAMRVNV